MKYDTKFIVWVSGIVFVAGGSWWSLHSASASIDGLEHSMSQLNKTLDEQAVTIKVHESNPEAHDDQRIKKLETQQNRIADDVKSLMINQNAICQATNARCR